MSWLERSYALPVPSATKASVALSLWSSTCIAFCAQLFKRLLNVLFEIVCNKENHTENHTWISYLKFPKIIYEMDAEGTSNADPVS